MVHQVAAYMLEKFSEIWSSFIILILGLYILYTQLGLAFIAAVVLTVLILLLIPILSRNIGLIEEKITALCDKRVRLIASILRQIKGIKLSAYEPELEAKVDAARKAELAARREFWGQFSIIVCLTNTTMNVLSLVTLG